MASWLDPRFPRSGKVRPHPIEDPVTVNFRRPAQASLYVLSRTGGVALSGLVPCTSRPLGNRHSRAAAPATCRRDGETVRFATAPRISMACPGRTAISGRIVSFHPPILRRVQQRLRDDQLDGAEIPGNAAAGSRGRGCRSDGRAGTSGPSSDPSGGGQVQGTVADIRQQVFRRVHPLRSDEVEPSRSKPPPVRSNGEQRRVDRQPGPRRPPARQCGPDDGPHDPLIHRGEPAGRLVVQVRLHRRGEQGAPVEIVAIARVQAVREQPYQPQRCEVLDARKGRPAGLSISMARNARSPCFAFRGSGPWLVLPSVGRCSPRTFPDIGESCGQEMVARFRIRRRSDRRSSGRPPASRRCPPGRGWRPSPVARRLAPGRRLGMRLELPGARPAAMYSRRSPGSRACSGGPGGRILGSESLSRVRGLPRGDWRPPAVRLRARLPPTAAAAHRAARPTTRALCHASGERREVVPWTPVAVGALHVPEDGGEHFDVIGVGIDGDSQDHERFGGISSHDAPIAATP